jgi:deoxyribose-phosphate aldolase
VDSLNSVKAAGVINVFADFLAFSSASADELGVSSTW